MTENEFNSKHKIILSKFKLLMEEAESDVVFSRATLEKHFDCTIKIAKWINKKSEWNSLLRAYEYKRSKLWKKTFEYYKTDYQLTVANKEEYTMLINSDLEYSNMNELTKLVKEVVNYIDEVVKTLRERQWEIKNFCDLLRWQSGA